MSVYLALFPLGSAVFPGEKLRLYIFEPRYKQLINDCRTESLTFGIPPVVDKKLANIFTEMRLVQIDRTYAGGEMDILTEGLRRARILRYDHQHPNKLYPGGEIEWIPTFEEAEEDLKAEVFNLLSDLNNALGITRIFAENASEIRSFSIGHHVGFSLQQEVKLLSLDKESDRLLFIRDHINEILPVVYETERMKAKAKLNGHYKNLIPPNF